MRLVRADTMHDAVDAIKTWVDDPDAPLPTCEEQS
jgi:PDZ domain-containing protein